MMRKAILIGAPGTIKSKNFLEGVEIDLNHFEFFYNIFFRRYILYYLPKFNSSIISEKKVTNLI